MSILKFFKKRILSLRTKSGAAILEFVIIASVFLLLLLGIFDFGKLNWKKWSLRNAVSHAAKGFETNPDAFQDIYNMDAATSDSSKYSAFLQAREDLETEMLNSNLKTLYQEGSLNDIEYCDTTNDHNLSTHNPGSCTVTQTLKIGILHPGMSAQTNWGTGVEPNWKHLHHSSVCSNKAIDCPNPKQASDSLAALSRLYPVELKVAIKANSMIYGQALITESIAFWPRLTVAIPSAAASASASFGPTTTGSMNPSGTTTASASTTSSVTPTATVTPSTSTSASVPPSASVSVSGSISPSITVSTTATPTVTPTTSASEAPPSPIPSPSSSSVDPSLTPLVTGSPSVTPSSTPSTSASSNPSTSTTPSAASTPSNSAPPSNSANPSSSPSSTPSTSPSVTPSTSPPSSVTSSATPTSSPTPSTSAPASASNSPPVSSSPSSTPSTSPSVTPSTSPPSSASGTVTPTPSTSPTSSPSVTPTSTPSTSISPTSTPTSTPSTSISPTSTPTSTATPSVSPSSTPSASSSASPSATDGGGGASPSATPSVSASASPSPSDGAPGGCACNVGPGTAWECCALSGCSECPGVPFQGGEKPECYVPLPITECTPPGPLGPYCLTDPGPWCPSPSPGPSPSASSAGGDGDDSGGGCQGTGCTHDLECLVNECCLEQGPCANTCGSNSDPDCHGGDDGFFGVLG